MASSSHYNNNQFLKNIEEEKGSKVAQEIEEEQEDDDEEEEWLQLKLGSGSAGTSCRKTVGHDESNPVSRSRSLGLGLGLELWPNMEKEGLMVGSDMVGVEVARRFIGRLPSWQMDSQDWYVPTPPDHSHHYWHTNPHHSGLWFTLRSSTNRRGEALPQVPKAYIRVKNEDMTIFMVKKYLVRKLGLSNESEIDILCMGQSLLNVQSLRLVRDTVWIPALVDSLHSTSKSLADSRGMSTINLMPLLYQKYPIANNSDNL